MGVGINTMNGLFAKVGGSLGIAANAAGDAISKDIKSATAKNSYANEDVKAKETHDAAMAAKARKVASEKLEAIYANKELSRKALSRRRNSILAELQGGDQ